MKQDKREFELFRSLLKGRPRLTWPVCWMWALLLVFAVEAGAEIVKDSLYGANLADARLARLQTAAADTTTLQWMNYGGDANMLCGYLGSLDDATATAYNIEYGRYLLGCNMTSIPDGDVLDSVFAFVNNDLTGQDNVEVTAFRAPTNWKPGTATGAYQQYSVSWRCRGAGTMFDGTTVANADTLWATRGGERVYAGTEPTVSVNATGFYKFNITDQVADSFYAGRNHFAVLFHDTVNGGGASHERWRPVSLENATPGNRPYVLVYHHAPVAEDSTFLRISVVPPSSPLTDYPVLVSFVTHGAKATRGITFYAADSVTKLYWWPESIMGYTTNAWVIHDWSSSPDAIFVQRRRSASYMNADSVFLLHEDFDEPFSLSRPVTDWDDYTATVFDTSGPMFIGETNVAVYADSVIREQGGVLRDWQETDASRRYKYFYCGERLVNSGTPSLRYNDNFLCWGAAPSLSGPWAKIDTVFYDSAGVRTPMRAEDPSIKWFANLNQWLMVVENHQVSDAYHVGLFRADSLDQEIWVFHGNIPCLEPSVLGQPANWLDKEQASPALGHYFPNEDTARMTFEAFGSNGLSYMGLAVSYDDVGAGDTLGLDWHLTDSTGVVNDANPMPIVPWGLAGQHDSVHTIPDALFYLNGDYIASNHGAGPQIEYKGSSLRDLVYQPLDSARIADHWMYDSTDGNWVGTMVNSASGNGDTVYLARARDWDSTRFPGGSEFTVHHRAARLGSYNRFVGGEVMSSAGQLLMYPSQWQTGSVTLKSKETFAQGFVVEMWAALRHVGDGAMHFNVSFGADTLQDYAGGQGLNSAWWDTESRRGYTFNFHSTAARWYRSSDGVLHSGVGSSAALDDGWDTLNTLHKYSLYYTTGDSLIMSVDGAQKVKGKDTNYSGLVGRLHLSQGERAFFNRGGIVYLDKVRVRKYTTADAVATAAGDLWAVADGGDGRGRQAWGREVRRGWGR